MSGGLAAFLSVFWSPKSLIRSLSALLETPLESIAHMEYGGYLEEPGPKFPMQ